MLKNRHGEFVQKLDLQARADEGIDNFAQAVAPLVIGDRLDVFGVGFGVGGFGVVAERLCGVKVGIREAQGFCHIPIVEHVGEGVDFDHIKGAAGFEMPGDDLPRSIS